MICYIDIKIVIMMHFFYISGHVILTYFLNVILTFICNVILTYFYVILILTYFNVILTYC